MDRERMDAQFAFCAEIDKEKQIGRQTWLADGSRKENDAEHAWHMAIMALILQEYSNEEIDLLRVISMILIHDIVEIDAGDTFAYDEEAKKDQEEREKKAADRIFSMLPEDQAKKFRALWDEFEAWETPEAKFARALDNAQPLTLQNAAGGKGWTEHGVRLEQVMKRNQRSSEGSQDIWEYCYENFISPYAEAGILKQSNHDEL